MEDNNKKEVSRTLDEYVNQKVDELIEKGAKFSSGDLAYMRNHFRKELLEEFILIEKARNKTL